MFLFVFFTREGKQATKPAGVFHTVPRKWAIQWFSVLDLAGESAALTGFPFTTALQLHSGPAAAGRGLAGAALWLQTKSLGEHWSMVSLIGPEGSGAASSCSTAWKGRKGLWGQ